MSAARRWSPGLPVVAAFAVAAWAWPRLPERMPIHFGWDGTPDGWGNRVVGALLLPGIMLGILLAMRLLPRLDPRRENWDRMRGPVDASLWGILGAMLVIHVAVIAYALGHPVNIGAVAMFAVGAMMAILGVAMRGARPNWFFGIRTPWTLSSDWVWERTHRAGGWVFALAGVVVMATPLFPRGLVAFVLPGAIGLAALGTVGYSWWAWREEHRPRG